MLRAELMNKQQEMWYKLGTELHSVVEELPKVKGKKISGILKIPDTIF